MSKDEDFAAGIYSEPKDTSIPTTESGGWRVAVFLPPARSSAELEARAAQYAAEAERGEHDIPFFGEDGLPEVAPLTEAEYDAFKDKFSPAEWAALLEELR